MDKEELLETDIWKLYQKHITYMSGQNMFFKTNQNFRFYNQNQWENANLKNIEPIQINYIKPIVNYKVAVVTTNNYAIILTPQIYDDIDFRDIASKTCEVLNQKFSQIMEYNNMNTKLKKAIKKACINGEIILYHTYDAKLNMPIVEMLSKVDVMYGNENEEDIQRQPYILMKKRMSVFEAREYAKSLGKSEEEVLDIHGDSFNEHESGDLARYELDDMCTIVYKLYKYNGTIHCTQAVKYLDLVENEDLGIKLYPLSKMNWEDCEGSARGIGEVEQHVQNQIEVNKTATRRAFILKNIAYPHPVYNEDMIQNPKDINKVGSAIKIKGNSNIEDVRKFFNFTTPGTINPDIKELQNELITVSRELAGAGDIATGQINPESASGKAILAVQRASEQPMNEQAASAKQFLEDTARVWFNMIQTYSEDLKVLNDKTDQATGQTSSELVIIPKQILDRLEIHIKIDITPESAFDRYAQEVSLENLSRSPLFLPQNQQILEDYVSLLDEKSTMPKQKLEELIKRRKAREETINQLDQEAMLLKQQMNSQLSDANSIEDMAQEGEILKQNMINEATE